MNANDVPAGHLAGEDLLPTVLLVEPDARHARELSEYLARQRVRVLFETRGDEALRRLADLAPGVVLIAADAPGLGGQEFCRHVRAAHNSVPIVVMANDSDFFSHVLCLELGADDYVANEVPGRLLWARMKVLLRRAVAFDAARQETASALRLGAFTLDRRALEVRLHGQAIALSMNEFNCLWVLAQHAGTVVSREDIRAAVNGSSTAAVHARSVDVHISRLRRKIDRVEPAALRIRSVRSLGYLFSPAGL